MRWSLCSFAAVRLFDSAAASNEPKLHPNISVYATVRHDGSNFLEGSERRDSRWGICGRSVACTRRPAPRSPPFTKRVCTETERLSGKRERVCIGLLANINSAHLDRSGEVE